LETFSKLIKGRSIPGIIIFDLNYKPLYFNQEAIDMINDFTKKQLTGIKNNIPKIITTLCKDLKILEGKIGKDNKTLFKSRIITNRFKFPISIRAFFLGGNKEDKSIHIMVLLEKIIKKHDIDFKKAQKKFNFSSRELDVIKLICNGYANKDISKKLFISEYTVKDHIKHILQKMGVYSRSQIITSLM